MTRWLRGPCGGLLAFLLIAALVAGGLGWATREALRLEEEQRLAAANGERADHLRQAQKERAEQARLEQTARAERLRLALWRLDARLSPALAREDSRPYPHYVALYSPFPALTPSGTAWGPGQVYMPSPLLSAELPEWMALHFQIDAAGWSSPQVVRAEVARLLRRQPIELALHNVTPERERLLRELNRKYPAKALVASLHDRGIVPEESGPSTVLVPQLIQNNSINPPGPQQQQIANTSNTSNGYNPTNGLGQYGGVPNANYNFYEQQDSQQRFNINSRAMNEGKYGYLYDGRNFAPWTVPFPQGARLPSSLPGGLGDALAPRPVGPPPTGQPVDVVLGPMRPVWLPSAAHPEHLLMVRAAQVGSRPVYQGFVLDWGELQKLLKLEIQDLFPDAKLLPRADGEPPNPDRALAALPVDLDPADPPAPEPPLPADGEPVAADELPPAGWTPLRIGLVLAWVAALVALLAVGLGGWSLIDLSERRIRFVSAVTHELRTPLTTLRLYLDLLTSGMVTDEGHRAEYLNTLHGESDRLYRLITNVLDFARLEKQRPKVEMRPLPVADLLEQARQDWRDRCTASGKELHVACDLAADAQLCTDAGLVQQILGNLIDNARKYSRNATDPRVVLRAVRDGDRLALEVEDRGPGVAKRERGSIFRPFRRGRDADVTAGGVGLGLALATRWACLLGGRLTVRAGDGGVGACFRLELPG